MISIAELDEIAAARLDDARALLAAGRFDGAAYVVGYAVELALKARICRMLHWHGFPSTNAEFRAYRSFRTHELEILLHLSGQEQRIRRDHAMEWSAAAEWESESRYYEVGTTQQAKVAAMIDATARLLAVL